MRVIGSISRRLQSSLSVYEEHLTDAHRELFGPLVLAVPKEVRFVYYRILRGFKSLLESLQDPLTFLVSQPRAP